TVAITSYTRSLHDALPISLVGRLGVPWSRPAALALLAAGLVPAAIRILVARKRARDPRAVMEATLLRTEPALGQAALRAMTLSEDRKSTRLNSSHVKISYA